MRKKVKEMFGTTGPSSHQPRSEEDQDEKRKRIERPQTSTDQKEVETKRESSSLPAEGVLREHRTFRHRPDSDDQEDSEDHEPPSDHEGEKEDPGGRRKRSWFEGSRTSPRWSCEPRSDSEEDCEEEDEEQTLRMQFEDQDDELNTEVGEVVEVEDVSLLVAPQTFPSQNGSIIWSSKPYKRIQQEQQQQKMQPWPPGPTAYAVSNAKDIVSTFRLFLTPEIDRIVLEETNREGLRKHGRDNWKQDMDEVDLHGYMGLLLLAGVYRSRGEATASLWDATSGRAIFHAAMSLDDFDVYSKLVRFDDRETRAERCARDKMAAVRRVWDLWTERLPTLYNPGRQVTVEEQLVPFKGRCPFRQYMPNKPAKCGIKSWVACDARSSYAWKMQMYTGKKPTSAAVGGGPGDPEMKETTSAVLDVTQGLTGRNITCNNFFASHELAQRLLHERNNTLIGAVGDDDPELPNDLLAIRGRPVFSSKFAFTQDTALVSYLVRRNQNMLLLSTLHADAGVVSCRPDRKPVVLLDYSSNRGGADNLDEAVGAYSCRRTTARWPLAVFHNVLDVSSNNAFVIWKELNPDWLPRKHNRRRVFLEQLGKALVAPLIERRARLLSTKTAAAVVETFQRLAAARDGDGVTAADLSTLSPAFPTRPPQDLSSPLSQTAGSQFPALAQEQTRASDFTAPVVPLPASKRKRCQVCPSKKDCKTYNVCRGCEKYICRGCALLYCPDCVNGRPLSTA